MVVPVLVLARRLVYFANYSLNICVEQSHNLKTVSEKQLLKKNSAARQSIQLSEPSTTSLVWSLLEIVLPYTFCFKCTSALQTYVIVKGGIRGADCMFNVVWRVVQASSRGRRWSWTLKRAQERSRAGRWSWTLKRVQERSRAGRWSWALKRVQERSRAGRWSWTLKRAQERSRAGRWSWTLRDPRRDQGQGGGAGPSRESRRDQEQGGGAGPSRESRRDQEQGGGAGPSRESRRDQEQGGGAGPSRESGRDQEQGGGAGLSQRAGQSFVYVVPQQLLLRPHCLCGFAPHGCWDSN